MKVFGFLLCLFSVGAQMRPPSVIETEIESPVRDIQWAGPNNRVVLIQSEKDRLWRSVDSGKNWRDVTENLLIQANGIDSPSLDDEYESISDAHTRNRITGVSKLVVSPADSSVVLAVGNSSKRRHFISTDAGATWNRVHHKLSVHSFIFHPTVKEYALASGWTASCNHKFDAAHTPEEKRRQDEAKKHMGPCTHMAFVTKDLGKTWDLLTSYVVQLGWGNSKDESQKNHIYFSHFREKTGDQPRLKEWSHGVDFHVSTDLGKSSQELVSNGNKFILSGQYIFVAKLNDLESQTVNLMVSTDGGKHFGVAELPEALHERSYTILDTSEDVVLLQVNHGHNDHGTVYVSDKAGLQYARTLTQNVRAMNGECEFEKVAGLEGIYLANVKVSADGQMIEPELEDMLEEDDEDASSEKKKTFLDKTKESNVEEVTETVITFDKGAYWNYLLGPSTDSNGQPYPECKNQQMCKLHLHGVSTFHNYAPYYSLDSAVGLVIGTGNLGEHLRFEKDVTHTFLSKNGGITWEEISRKPYIYEFGDHGGLIVMADDVDETNSITYSWTEGKEWESHALTNQNFAVDNVVIGPGATSTNFVVYGSRDSGTGVLFHVDFSNVGVPICRNAWSPGSEGSDYYLWSPTDGQNLEGCLLGKQVSYTRRLDGRRCFNGEEFERKVDRKVCQCTIADYGCEEGFTRNVGSLECLPVYVEQGSSEWETVPNGCQEGQSTYFPVAYRKVVGDVCEGGWTPPRTAFPCPNFDPSLMDHAYLLFILLVVVVVALAISNMPSSWQSPSSNEVELHGVIDANRMSGGSWFSRIWRRAQNPQHYATIGQNEEIDDDIFGDNMVMERSPKPQIDLNALDTSNILDLTSSAPNADLIPTSTVADFMRDLSGHGKLQTGRSQLDLATARVPNLSAPGTQKLAAPKTTPVMRPNSPRAKQLSGKIDFGDVDDFL